MHGESDQGRSFAYVQEWRTASWELPVQPGLRVGTNRSSEERPEVLLVLVLPVKPDLINHLEGVPNFGLSSFITGDDR